MTSELVRTVHTLGAVPMRLSNQHGWWDLRKWSMRQWAIVLCVLVLSTPLVNRWICLRKIPDVVLPFDVEAVIQPDVPKEGDAFAQYEVSAKMAAPFVDVGPFHTLVREALQNPDAPWDDQITQFLVKYRPALLEFRRATDMPRAGGLSLRTVDDAIILTTHERMSELSAFAELEALRCERVGEFDEAWKWHCANLHCSNHAQSPGFVRCQYWAAGIRFRAFRGIAHWAQEPSLTASQLRAVRTEVTELFSKRMPLADVAKADYLLLRNTMRRSDAPNVLYPGSDSASVFEPGLLFAKRQGLWAMGQPELLMRLARQSLLNMTDQIDRPLHERSKRVEGAKDVVFELDPKTKRVEGQLEPSVLAKALNDRLDKLPADSVPFLVPTEDELPFFAWMSNIESRFRDGTARFAMLDVVLAAQEYQRAHGEFPASIEELVPAYLDVVPFDPLDPNGAPLHYRRNENGDAFVWHVDRDGKDDGFQLDRLLRQDRCFHIRLSRRPSTQSTPATREIPPETGGKKIISP